MHLISDLLQTVLSVKLFGLVEVKGFIKFMG